MKKSLKSASVAPWWTSSTQPIYSDAVWAKFVVVKFCTFAGPVTAAAVLFDFAPVLFSDFFRSRRCYSSKRITSCIATTYYSGFMVAFSFLLCSSKATVE
jgi:hypothetical protein